MPTIEQFASSIRSYAAITVDAPANIIRVHQIKDQTLDPPLLVHLDPRAIEASIRAIAPEARDIFPDVAPEEGALRLLLVHLEELVLTRPIPNATIVITD